MQVWGNQLNIGSDEQVRATSAAPPSKSPEEAFQTMEELYGQLFETAALKQNPIFADITLIAETTIGTVFKRELVRSSS